MCLMVFVADSLRILGCDILEEDREKRKERASYRQGRQLMAS